MKSKIIKLIISTLFIIVICLKVDWKDIGNKLSDINMFYFWMSIAIAFVMLFTSCFKWWLMLRMQGARLGFLFLLKNYYIGYLFTVLLPSNIGGDVVRSYYIGKRINGQFVSAVAVFLERFTGIIFLFLLAVISPFLNPDVICYWRVIIPMIGSLILLVFILLLFRTDRLLQFSNTLILKVFSILQSFSGKLGIRFLGRLLEKTAAFYCRVFEKGMKFYRKLMKAMKLFKHHPGYLFATIVLTVLFYVWTWLNVLFGFLTFNVNVGFSEIVSLLPIIMIVSMIPITFGSIGLAEGAYVFYFALVNIPREAALIMSFLLRFKLMLMALAGFFFYLTYKHRSEDYKVMAAVKAQEDIVK
jgi:glycosyltransferase 2 family protein